MKNNQMNLRNFTGIEELSLEEIKTIEGGGFWYDISYITAVGLKLIYTFAKDAVEYQRSLPPNLKK